MKIKDRFIAMLLVGLVSVAAIANLGAGNETKMPVPESTTSRTVLAECFTGTWCQYCPGAEGALNRLANEMNRTQLAIIEWHVGDSYEASDGSCSARANYYGVPGYPTTFFDGLNPSIGGSTNANDAATYNDYKSKINSRLGVASPVSISVSGYIDGTNGIVNAAITVLDPLPASTNGTYVHFVLCEDKNKSVISGGRTYWLRFDAVKKLGMDLLNIGVGQTLTLQKSFTVDASWEEDRLWVVVFVQTSDRTYHGGTYTYYTSEVYQSSTLNLSAQPVPEHSTGIFIPVFTAMIVVATVFLWRRTSE
ncbi:MAG: hypothetical protein N3F63_03605 [Thermoplasmata archaeon]|nr:hypothetical protein [Thermoplasmata archaeon]